MGEEGVALTHVNICDSNEEQAVFSIGFVSPTQPVCRLVRLLSLAPLTSSLPLSAYVLWGGVCVRCQASALSSVMTLHLQRNHPSGSLSLADVHLQEKSQLRRFAVFVVSCGRWKRHYNSYYLYWQCV